jgi:hypothetical protein
MDRQVLADRLAERVSRLYEWGLVNVDEAGEEAPYTTTTTHVSTDNGEMFRFRVSLTAGPALLQAMQQAVSASVVEAGGGGHVARIARRQVARNLAGWESTLEGSTDDRELLADLTGHGRTTEGLERAWRSALARLVRLAIQVAALFGTTVAGALADLIRIALRAVEVAAASVARAQLHREPPAPSGDTSACRVTTLMAPHGPDLSGVPVAA